jgi:nucleoside-diphosphate-sugar epimerase
VAALGKSRRPFVYTSGVWVLGPTGESVADERSPIAPIEAVAWRGALERWLQEETARGAHAVVVRPGVVHGDGGGIPGKTASGALPVVGRGDQRWSVVHVDDLAALYVAAAERAKPGAILHGVADVVSVAELVGDGPLVRHDDLATARAALGPFAEALAITQVVSSAETQATIGWTPKRFVARTTLAGVGNP